MKTKPVMFAAVVLLLTIAVAGQKLPEPTREFRAAWLTTVDNIDFPSRKGLTIDQQKAELDESVRLAREMRLNAIIFQVRPMADAVYESKIEPWSDYLTGEMGRPQAFDPLKYLIEIAHRDGILVHAWFNPYRAWHPSAKTVAAGHISKTRPNLVRKYGNFLWLDPTDEAVQRYSLDVIKDVVKRYDIDGVHFDDYFYPYPENDANGKQIEFPDDKNWEAYLRTAAETSSRERRRRPLSRSEWRRMHVNRFIEAVGREVKRIKPQIMYGISPFGIWRPMPELGIQGLDSTEGLYADSRKWLQDGTVDYFVPQLYWETARRAQSYPILLKWWRQQNTKGRHIWPGLAAYRIGSNPNFTAAEVVNQIELTRSDSSSPGAVFFSFKSLRNDLGGFRRALTNDVYARSALIPLSPWIRSSPPRRPSVSIERGAEITRAFWKPAAGSQPLNYVVYVKDADGWSYSIVPAAETSMSLTSSRKITEVVVKAVDRLGNLSR